MSDHEVITAEPERQIERSLITVGEAQIQCFSHGEGPAIVIPPGGRVSG